ncbi:bifunctional 2-polyprenyl-6-hydroxyphenol methylase/3-demethylubiquinol 3-O-methyltransferase UbiG [Brachybacterium sp. FME24]|uniref:class I SAM-dependent methyltransferase n=1 Tax=Brachybacterium sp. FME24 TaxID=2742605 RepID=UPI0018688CD4|nr:class I SAM-dependent methyltransferase [Brachybacterium sp. FME24]
MNIRTTANPLVRWIGRRLEQLNARHPWSHNHHFHPWILRALPTPAGRVLDVGCGRGDLIATLAGHAGRVDGIDPDQEMAYVSASRFREEPRVQVWRRSLAEHVGEPELLGAYDAITMVASLHHMDLDEALTDARALLRPGGRLLVVTLTDPVSTLDQIWDVTNALTNPLIGVVKHPRPVRETPAEVPIPVQDPDWSIAELRERAGIILPGAVTRRREGFRATLRWQKPGTVLETG